MKGSLSKPRKVANDLYILDLGTLSWIVPTYGSEALTDMLNGHGPPPVYGHVAIPVQHASGRADMLIFGGSSNADKTIAACQFGMFLLNSSEHTWNKADTGYLFPPERCGHSMSVCMGWSPVYNFPLTRVSAASTQTQTQTQTRSNHIHSLRGSDSTERVTAIIFSGLSSLGRTNDVWCLDITPGRPSGRTFYLKHA